MARIPPFAVKPRATVSGVVGGMNFSTLAGATELARRIREAWLRAGWAVQVRVEPLNRAETAGKSTFVVRSDLVNALPRPGSWIGKQNA